MRPWSAGRGRLAPADVGGEVAASHRSGDDSVGLPMSLPIDSILFNRELGAGELAAWRRVWVCRSRRARHGPSPRTPCPNAR